MKTEEPADLDRRRARVRQLVVHAAAQAAAVTPFVHRTSETSTTHIGQLERALPGFEFARELSRGGQGVVFEAVQRATRRRVAIKVLKEGPFAGQADRVRFEREVQILGALQHPGIVTIHDSGTAAGVFYYVMDYIPGPALDDHVAALGRPIRPTVELFVTVCAAVDAAHLLGVVHRDLRPNNIRVDAKGYPRLLDFGLAKASGARESSEVSGITLAGQFVGRLPWASPEQARGDERSVDPPSDVYSLGVLLYQMLTGEFPYPVTSAMATTLQSIMSCAPRPPRRLRADIDRDLHTILLKCLNKEPERRYATAGELGRDLQRWLSGEPIEARRDSAVYVVPKTLSRYRGRVAAALAFFVLTTVAAVALLVLYARQSTLLDRVSASADEAHREALRSEPFARFTREMLSGIDPAIAVTRSVHPQVAPRSLITALRTALRLATAEDLPKPSRRPLATPGALPIAPGPGLNARAPVSRYPAPFSPGPRADPIHPPRQSSPPLDQGPRKVLLLDRSSASMTRLPYAMDARQQVQVPRKARDLLLRWVNAAASEDSQR
ncbi:MAG: serine/threonine-protein kinase [Planctomycetota bacterium]